MTSKQRTQTVFAKQLPDRPPLGFLAIDSDTASKVLGRETYWRSKAKCQIAFWQGRRDEVVQSWITDGIELYKKLDIIDIIPTASLAAGLCPPKDYDPDPPRQLDADTWEDKKGRVYKYSSATQDITIVHDPDMWTREYTVENESWDGTTSPPDESIFEVVDAIIAEFKDDRFILGPYGRVGAWLLPGGTERGLMEIAARPDDVKKIYATHIERAKTEDRYYLRPGQDGVLLGTDLSGTTGSMINPQTYRELFLEPFTSRIAHLKSKGQAIVKHACGNNWALLDIFVEMGIDCYQSIQASAEMDILEVQKNYGDKFAVWGGVNVENLIGGTRQDVRNDVDRVMRQVAPNGGFILGTSHSVAVGTKYDNFMAMLDEFSKWI